MYKLANEVPAFRATAWFEIHSRTSASKATPEHQAFLKQCPVPLWMWQAYPDLPNSVRFPKDEIIADFTRRGFGGAAYYTNSISWELAFAIYLTLKGQGYKTIGLYGVDMANDSEYCVSPETRVLTADLRWVEAGSVEVGDKLIAFDEESDSAWDEHSDNHRRHWRCATVEVAQELVRPCYRIHLADGTTLVSSAEHRWLTGSEHMHKWRATENLVTRHHRPSRPSKLVKLFDVWDEAKTWEAGYLAAAFDGEGHLCQRPQAHSGGYAVSVGFAQRDNEMMQEVRSALATLGFGITGKEWNDNCGKYNIQGGRSEIMRFLGQVRPRRLLAKFDPHILGSMQTEGVVPVTQLEFIGDQRVIGLKTSTGTFVAEGFASHNSHQRPSCEYFIGLAEGLGIEIIIPPASDLLKCTQLYGFESSNKNSTWIKAQMGEMDKRVEAISQQKLMSHEQVRRLEIAQAEARGAKGAYYEILKRTQ